MRLPNRSKGSLRHGFSWVSTWLNWVCSSAERSSARPMVTQSWSWVVNEGRASGSWLSYFSRVDLFTALNNGLGCGVPGCCTTCCIDKGFATQASACHTRARKKQFLIFSFFHSYSGSSNGMPAFFISFASFIFHPSPSSIRMQSTPWISEGISTWAL